MEEVQNYVVEISSSDLGTDVLKIFVDCPQIYDGIEKEIKDKFRAKLRIAPELSLLDREEILKMQKIAERRKPIKFIDNRKI
jgi:phenylacetate-CoA ligase